MCGAVELLSITESRVAQCFWYITQVKIDADIAGWWSMHSGNVEHN